MRTIHPDMTLQQAWLDRWQRRGELIFALSFTATVTWITGVVPGQSQSHVDVWPPLFLFGVLVLLSVYVIAAVEYGWPLPGRARIRRIVARQAEIAMREGIDEFIAGHSHPLARDLRAVATALEKIAEALPAGDQSGSGADLSNEGGSP